LQPGAPASHPWTADSGTDGAVGGRCGPVATSAQRAPPRVRARRLNSAAGFAVPQPASDCKPSCARTAVANAGRRSSPSSAVASMRGRHTPSVTDARAACWPVAIASPRANAVIERLIGTLRRECLDHLIVLDEQHLQSVLREFVGYYNLERPHRTLRLETPVP